MGLMETCKHAHGHKDDDTLAYHLLLHLHTLHPPNHYIYIQTVPVCDIWCMKLMCNSHLFAKKRTISCLEEQPRFVDIFSPFWTTSIRSHHVYRILFEVRRHPALCPGPGVDHLQHHALLPWVWNKVCSRGQGWTAAYHRGGEIHGRPDRRRNHGE